MLIKIAYRSVLVCLLISISVASFAQVEVVTPQLINQYDLNLTDPQPQPNRHQLVLGSDALISQGYDVTIDALYLLDTVNNSVELISQTLSGQPVALETELNFQLGSVSVIPYHASNGFEKIIYASRNNDIVSGDTVDTYDVFIVDRSTQQTTRIQGRQPHEGYILDIRISPAGNTVTFESQDWNFGDTSGITGYGVGEFQVIYIYDLKTASLTTPIVEKLSFQQFGADFTLGLAGDLVFSIDGRKLLFVVEGEDVYYPWTDYYSRFYVHNLNSNQTSNVLDEEGRHFSTISSNFQPKNRFLDQNHILFSYIHSNDFDSRNQVFVFNFESDTVLNIPAGRHEVQDGQSADGRYVTFFDLPDGTEHTNFKSTFISEKSGDILVLDLLTDELKQAFTVNRFSKASVTTGGVDYYFTECGFFYVPNSDFNQYWQDALPSNTYLLCDETYPADINEYVQSSVDAYDLSPSNVKFHNNGQYITFEANSWHLDESISFEDFTPMLFDATLPPEYQYIVERPYARDTFVVKNPFIENTINLIGEPVVDQYSETGIYLWQDNSGTTFLRAYAGGSAQGGNSTRFAGTITSGAAITAVTPLSLESSSATPDTLTQVASNQVAFELFVVKPYRDDFSFIAEPGTSLCVDLSDYAGGLFLGPNKVEVISPYDIDSLLDCDKPSIEVDGAPVVDAGTDAGWFIWRDNGIWHNHFIAGGTRHHFKGSLTSTSQMTNLLPISIESNDVLGSLPSTQLNFELAVRSPYRDGFSLQVDTGASTCASLEAPTGVSIHLGPDRVEMPRSFDLSTLLACKDGPDIETLGKPNINRATDKGIFLWERAANDWSAEVVTGDTTVSVIDIDVQSQQSLSNVVPVGIESNDIFTVLPQQLDMSLRVKAPWYDGFQFSAQIQSATCVSTPNTAMPIYFGPDRIDVGSSVNLDTQVSCR